MIVIDGKGKIVGRVAAYAAKRLLVGEEVVILNADEMVFSGDKTVVFNRYKARRDIKPKQNPRHKPIWPRRPDLLVRRIVRGMLPWRTQRGRNAFKKLRVYRDVPKEFENVEKVVLDGKYDGSHLNKSVTVLTLCRMLGFTG